MDTAILIISYYSYGFMQQVVESTLHYVPEAKFLVIDNNPSIKDQPERAESYLERFNTRFINKKLNKKLKTLEELKEYKKTHNKEPQENIALQFVLSNIKLSPVWQKQFCEAEREWINSHPRIEVIQTEKYMSHGTAINFAMREAQKRSIKRVVHIEADCLVTDGKWYYNLLDSLSDSLVVVGGDRPSPKKTALITPSIWWVDKAVNLDMRNVVEREKTVEECPYPDTAGAVWYMCLKEKTAKVVDTPGFEHLWCGRSRLHPLTISYL
jgi:hypothetical protein